MLHGYWILRFEPVTPFEDHAGTILKNLFIVKIRGRNPSSSQSKFNVPVSHEFMHHRFVNLRDSDCDAWVVRAQITHSRNQKLLGHGGRTGNPCRTSAMLRECSRVLDHDVEIPEKALDRLQEKRSLVR